jgi:L-aspartate oxidase
MAIDPRLTALIVTKDQLEESNSSYAQGGIATVLGADDRFEDHIADTLAAGAGLCDREIVEMVVREAPGHIRQLIEWGTSFDQTEGELVLGREGGHSHNRIVHALGDATGQEIMRAMIARARNVLHAQVWQNTFTIDLLTHEGRCRGALVWNDRHGKTYVWAKQTILATGGAGQIFRETTNPPVATGDGHAAAFRAGAELMDMEFMQFHPTVLYIAGSGRSLITEAVRGEGALLVDAAGVRFMPEYHPQAELAPRDVVSQAIVDRMEKTHHPCVYLDLSAQPADAVPSPSGAESSASTLPRIAFRSAPAPIT